MIAARLSGIATAVALAILLPAADQLPCRTDVNFDSPSHIVKLAVKRTSAGILVPVRLNRSSEQLWFLFDTGAARTVIDRATAARLGLKPTGKGTISGVGSGATPVDIVDDRSLAIGGVRLDHIDFRIATISGDASDSEPQVNGIIGYDLLCGTMVTLDYRASLITIRTPEELHVVHAFAPLPLTIRGGWIFVTGTIKVPGNAPVTDEFLVDTGSLDDVNHPIIRKSTGPLRKTQTGAGGFGKSLEGVIGRNEWFRLGYITIPSTQSVCCAASEEVSRQIGEGILSRFRLTFDYPHRLLMLEYQGNWVK